MISSVDRAPALQAGCWRFDSAITHQYKDTVVALVKVSRGSRVRVPSAAPKHAFLFKFNSNFKYLKAAKTQIACASIISVPHPFHCSLGTSLTPTFLPQIQFYSISIHQYHSSQTIWHWLNYSQHINSNCV